MILDGNAHSVFLLNYHLIFVTQYRRPVINNEISNRAKEIFEYIAPNYNITLQEWHYESDYVHILFQAHPNSMLSKFINAYKTASSRLIKKDFPEIIEKLYENRFWCQSFCLISTGNISTDVIKEYVKHQGQEYSKQGRPRKNRNTVV